MTFALGVTSALVAPFSMVVGFLIWDNHWTGSAFSLNMYKCNLAALGFAIVVWLSSSSPRITNSYGNHDLLHDNKNDDDESPVFTSEKVGFLMLSSAVGILLGDWAWLEGMRIVGARKVIAMDSMKPFFAALVGNIFLGESLPLAGFVGLILTVVGVALVGLEQENNHSSKTSSSTNSSQEEAETGQSTIDETTSLLDTKEGEKTATAAEFHRSESYAYQRKHRLQSSGEICYGLVIAFLNVVFHTFGALITKKYGDRMTTWEICLIRFGFASIFMTSMSLFLWFKDNMAFLFTTKPDKQNSDTSNIQSEPIQWYSLPSAKPFSWLTVSVGVAFVSFLQPALTNYALFQISLALLLTLESIGPLYSLPLAFVMQHEIPTFQATVGAISAVTGIVILSFKGVIDEQ
mmetsp:Transcript_18869/g.24277  ORF Transcript_18869/g.24277 Transcript_18869/m.24277 type:complete len:405 (+) Transcript_18869:113-1327(+)|eukprot:CAMPEP_0198144818 /NCGR_PEP_ID=MMETSP1443-20131203/18689_1 /TAXON_ID=186043 /ORGANISM="Entomoneis sp., Strain CCMP2396" /LENGTH=404 /DNA_ID=CAMNT_0043808281 /DNA_START=21 /DNA_END=1235 /DNA_ORIENTATION=-